MGYRIPEIVMLRFTPIANARHAESYYAKSDGGYYLQDGGLHCEWGGKGAALLGLSGPPDYEQFRRLIHGLDPHSGEQLTAKLIEERIPGWDVTARVPKGVTTALERGDERIRQVLWEAGREALADLEELATTRVRKGGRQEDRRTQNIVWYAKEDAETRPVGLDGSNMPDWDRHIHFVVLNVTKDMVEGEWKAVKFRPIMDLRKWFSHRFDLRLAHKLADLGYEIETQYKADGKGGRKYYSWDIKGVPPPVISRFSRRHAEVEATERAVLQQLREEKGVHLDQLDPVASDKLAATSRQLKRDDLTLADYRAYWNSRITPQEGLQIAETIRRARQGANPRPANTADKGAAYAVAHEFERNSVVAQKQLEITAMERCMGGALPEDIAPQLRNQGVLMKDGQATTQTVLAQEGRILAFAREGRGTMRPLGRERLPQPGTLSADQQAAIYHVWNSPDQVILIRGGAGTGKTTMMKTAIAGIDRPAVVLAPSADASRAELRSQGFPTADTVAQFLGKPAMQQQARGGVLWVDEAGLLPIQDLDRLCGIARDLGARLVLQGDPAQHKAVSRHGNMLNVLHDYAGLPAAELKEIQRQKGAYAQAVAAIRDGRWQQADARLRDLGWVVEGQGHADLVEEYARALKERKAVTVEGKVEMVPKTIIVVDPTHRDGDQLSERLRALRKAEGLIDGADRTFTRLVPLGWTEAEKGDAGRYAGNEVIQFFRNCGPYKAGQRLKAAEMLPQLARLKAEHFQVYAEQPIPLARGDLVRITTGVKSKDGHRIDNGRIDTIAGFTAGGDPVLSNGWVLDSGGGLHLKHGLVSTSYAAQSKTQDIVLAAMNRASLGALGAEQVYVTVSRGRERGMIFTDLTRDALLGAMRRHDTRQSATELLSRPAARPQGKVKEKACDFVRRMQHYYRRLRRKLEEATREVARERGPIHAGFAR